MGGGNFVYIKMNKRRSGIGKILYNELENILKMQGILNLNACIACLSKKMSIYPTIV